MEDATKQLIHQFVGHYNCFRARRLAITRWPDDQPTKEEQTGNRCDAIAEQDDLTVVIEHTTIDSFVDQRSDSYRFMRAVGDLEQELKGHFTDRIHLSVAVGSIPTGVDWRALKDRIRTWLVKNAPGLQCGRQDYRIEDIPVPISISKEKSNKPGLFVSRFAPKDSKDQMAKAMKKVINDKNNQLRSYHETGDHTVVLLESNDIALANASAIQSAVKKTLDSGVPSDNIDELWLADTSLSRCQFHLLIENRESST